MAVHCNDAEQQRAQAEHALKSQSHFQEVLFSQKFPTFRKTCDFSFIHAWFLIAISRVFSSDI